MRGQSSLSYLLEKTKLVTGSVNIYFRKAKRKFKTNFWGLQNVLMSNSQEWYFKQNSRIIDLVVKDQEHWESFSNKNSSESSKSKSHSSNTSSYSSTSSHTKSSVNNIHFQKA